MSAKDDNKEERAKNRKPQESDRGGNESLICIRKVLLIAEGERDGGTDIKYIEPTNIAKDSRQSPVHFENSNDNQSECSSNSIMFGAWCSDTTNLDFDTSHTLSLAESRTLNNEILSPSHEIQSINIRNEELHGTLACRLDVKGMLVEDRRDELLSDNEEIKKDNNTIDQLLASCDIMEIKSEVPSKSDVSEIDTEVESSSGGSSIRQLEQCETECGDKPTWLSTVQSSRRGLFESRASRIRSARLRRLRHSANRALAAKQTAEIEQIFLRSEASLYCVPVEFQARQDKLVAGDIFIQADQASEEKSKISEEKMKITLAHESDSVFRGFESTGSSSNGRGRGSLLKDFLESLVEADDTRATHSFGQPKVEKSECLLTDANFPPLVQEGPNSEHPNIGEYKWPFTENDYPSLVHESRDLDLMKSDSRPKFGDDLGTKPESKLIHLFAEEDCTTRKQSSLLGALHPREPSSFMGARELNYDHLNYDRASSSSSEHRSWRSNDNISNDSLMTNSSNVARENVTGDNSLTKPVSRLALLCAEIGYTPWEAGSGSSVGSRASNKLNRSIGLSSGENQTSQSKDNISPGVLRMMSAFEGKMSQFHINTYHTKSATELQSAALHVGQCNALLQEVQQKELLLHQHVRQRRHGNEGVSRILKLR